MSDMGRCGGTGMVAYWDGSAYAGEFCRGCVDCEPPETAEAVEPHTDRNMSGLRDALRRISDIAAEGYEATKMDAFDQIRAIADVALLSGARREAEHEEDPTLRPGC